MKLQVGGYLPFYLPQKQAALEIPLQQTAPLKEILAGLGIPLAEVHLVAINGVLADLETATVQNADVALVFSAVNGG